MPDQNYILIIRPKNCHYCGNGFYALAHAIEQIKNLSMNPNLQIIDLSAEQADNPYIIDTINQYDPLLVISFGHGNTTVYTADSENPVFTMENIDILAGRIWHTLSCLVGAKLGPEMVKRGGLAFSGYEQEWTWVVYGTTEDDPYEDKYAKGFYISDNQCSITLAITLDIKKASEEAIKEYNRWIDYWIENPDDDENAVEIAKWLIWDRDAYVVFVYQAEHIAKPSPLLPLAIMGLPVLLGLTVSAKHSEFTISK